MSINVQNEVALVGLRLLVTEGREKIGNPNNQRRLYSNEKVAGVREATSAKTMKWLLHKLGLMAAVIISLLLAATPCQAGAKWRNDGVPICVDGTHQAYPRMITDGQGGAIMTWADERNNDIYAQRIDVNGETRWGTDGVNVCYAGGDQNDPDMISDGLGGAIIVWVDERSNNKDIFAQRIDPDGSPTWGIQGKPVCIQEADQSQPVITSDGQGGAIIAWADARSVGMNGLYAQRIDQNGEKTWDPDDVLICSNAYSQVFPQICEDGSNGAIVTWHDGRSGPSDIYAQRIDANGEVPEGWDSDGVGICTAEGVQESKSMAFDGENGALITWKDQRSGTHYDVYAQHISSSGEKFWGEQGLEVCPGADHQEAPSIISDGANGAFIAWHDARNGQEDIFAQWIDSYGDRRWGGDGLAVCDYSGIQSWPRLAADGEGGVFLVWEDYRQHMSDVYAQRLDRNGSVHEGWPEGGAEICGAYYYQWGNQIVSGLEGEAIVSWGDCRTGAWDIYAQKVADPEPAIDGISPDFGINDGKKKVTISGAGFLPGATARLEMSNQSDIVAADLEVVSSKEIDCTFDLKGKKTGQWNLVVQNPDNYSAERAKAFEVQFPAPAVNGINPNSGNITDKVVAITDLSGTGFGTGPKPT